ncbi:hypothetical protein NHQ30_009226 [Ciborinia camelliae]|nr:hypothetical protein NHQ30_009226 [Ciborinia camelliae]
MAKMLYRLGKGHDAEATIRPVVQIALAGLGPSHRLTMNAIELLAVILESLGKLVDAANLIRYTLQVLENISHAWDWVHHARTLVDILSNQGLFEESINLNHRILILVEEVFGNESTLYFDTQISMADIIKRRGKISESVDMYRRLLGTYYSRRKPGSMLESILIHSLAHCLWKQENVWEALFYYKKLFKLEVERNGWEHEYVFIFCQDIGTCYEKLSRYDDALEFCGRVLEKWRGIAKKSPHIEKWIDKIEYQMYHIREWMKENTNSEDGDDVDYDEAGSDVSEVEVCDALEKGESDESKFKGSGPSLDDIFKWERDTSKDITFEKLGLKKDFLDHF